MRRLERGFAVEETILLGEQADPSPGRPLQVELASDGALSDGYRGAAGVDRAREHRAMAVAELPADAHRLARGEPAIPTVFR